MAVDLLIYNDKVEFPVSSNKSNFYLLNVAVWE